MAGCAGSWLLLTMDLLLKGTITIDSIPYGADFYRRQGWSIAWF